VAAVDAGGAAPGGRYPFYFGEEGRGYPPAGPNTGRCKPGIEAWAPALTSQNPAILMEKIWGLFGENYKIAWSVNSNQFAVMGSLEFCRKRAAFLIGCINGER
jgi:hypothetical protein